MSRSARAGLILCMVALMLGLTAGLRAQTPQVSLDEKYKTALQLYDRGDLQGARKLLLEVKEGIKAGELKVAPETAKAIDDRLVEIDKTVAEAPAAGTATTPEAAPPGQTAEQRFEELRRNPAIVQEMLRRQEEAQATVVPPTAPEGAQQTFERARRNEVVRQQRTEEEIRAKLNQGIDLLKYYRFDDADKLFRAAEDQVRFSDFSDEWKRAWLGRIQDVMTNAVAVKQNYQRGLAKEQQQQSALELEQQMQETRVRLEKLKARLTEQWDIFFNRGQFEDALLVLKQLENLDPTDKDVAKKVDLTRRKMLEVDNIEQNKERLWQWAQGDNADTERMTPWFPIYRYPDYWKELSEKRLRASEQRELTETPENRRIRQQLEETVVSFAFADQPVKEALDFLQTLGRVNIVADWPKFVDPNQTVTLKLGNVTLETALKLLTEQLGKKFVIREGVVFISDETGVRLPPETVVYEVRDLLASLPEFAGPAFDLSAMSSSNQTSGGGSGGYGSGGGSGGGTSLWGTGGTGGGGTGGGAGTTTEQSESPEQSLNNLIDLISQVIEPGNWDPGTGNAIRGRAGTIIVTNTPEVLRKVQQLLSDLRKARAIQVMVDIRFLTVSDAFMEEMGIDWSGFVLDIHNDGGSVITASNFNLLANATGNVFPALPVVAGSTPGLSLSGAFLDDVTVNFFLTAVQRSFRNNTMQAPRITMMNGQRAYLAVAQQINYVSDVTVDVAEGAVGYDPTISTIQDGIVFDVRPTVSADRRYVQLDLRPAVARVIAIDNFPVLSATGGLGTSVNIQLPRLQVSMVRCSVSVPDGGTLMVGGLSYGFDADTEAGIPILSKIPIVGRAFRRRAIDQEKQTVLILVKPTIIIQEEYEAAQQ